MVNGMSSHKSGIKSLAYDNISTYLNMILLGGGRSMVIITQQALFQWLG